MWFSLQILTSILAGINLFVLVHNIIQSEYTADYLYPTLLVCSYVSFFSLIFKESIEFSPPDLNFTGQFPTRELPGIGHVL